MKQIWLRKTGGPEVLTLEEGAALREPGETEVQIDVHYSGINFADVIMRLGLYGDAPKRPYVPGYEVSGTILKVGRKVTHLKIGDSVASGSIFGGYASEIIVDADLVFPLPAHLDLREAAALPVNWITAHAAIHDMGRVRSGDHVLVDAASGGVGTVALQILRLAGAETIGLTSSVSKKKLIESYGARAMTHDEFHSMSGKPKFDLILNSQGGRSVRDHYNLLGHTGRVVAFGMSSAIQNGKRNLFHFLKMAAAMPRFSLISMFDHNRGVYALNALSLLGDEIFRKSLPGKWSTVSEGKIRPHIGGVYPAAEIGKAQHFLETKGASGKVLIQWK